MPKPEPMSPERRVLFLQAVSRAIGEIDAATYAADEELFSALGDNLKEAKRLLTECR